MIVRLTQRFFIVAAVMVLLFLLAYVLPPLFIVAKVLTGMWALVVLADVWMLFGKARKMEAERTCQERFSNGDENPVTVRFNNPYPFAARVDVIDEMPVQFQMRDFILHAKVAKGEERTVRYVLTPKTRGEYRFDRIRLFFTSPIGLLQRRFTRGTAFTVKVYPSFAHLSLYSMLAIHHNLTDLGIKRVRQVGADTEFDQIKDYVQGDDYRNINWKASARANSLKVNVYQQERSQAIYSIIDKGRMMQQTAHGMTFFDYAINATLALSYVALKKEDYAGLLSFAKTVDGYVPAAKQGGQIQKLMESLYKEQTIFSESDYSALVTTLRQKVTKRSLIVLYANFATMNQLQRELPYLRQISSQHRLIVVIFKDQEMDNFMAAPPANTEEYYQQMMVEKYQEEKELIAKTLRQNAITTIVTLPDNLSVSVINKYLDVRRF